jgi:hypothetical protein
MLAGLDREMRTDFVDTTRRLIVGIFAININAININISKDNEYTTHCLRLPMCMILSAMAVSRPQTINSGSAGELFFHFATRLSASELPAFRCTVEISYS